ncbi:hypothetical protein SAMN05443287_106194 [Micromonospora phaseoli]|uniref:Uncharacterized protein n=1 Tax=Micromonospora phaseoli TaxID=1144548 RepID=A0A1H7AQC9_9ACTN|nr:hypothetical protein [Micromonospora phaseoli]PZV96316.1 hypothetical protein CLV64_107194 [Micromonospora phaseoli]GIJ76001.1 hypothetical protein Xph01_04330 [Micromonospora phaseoli]SEJ66067.1 hypothetical protein SAMN05443287_106194 [Micromonospora phaseoli]
MIYDNLTQSPWLSDWRQFYDEAENVSPRVRRLTKRAIQKAEAGLKTKHRQSYREKLKVRNTKRNEGVIGRCDELIEDLEDLIDAMESGRVSPSDVLVKCRNTEAEHGRITDLHNELICRCDPDEDCHPGCREAELEKFEALTPDEYQRELPNRFRVLDSEAGPYRTLGSVLEEEARLDCQSPSSLSAPVGSTDAPSADDINWSES